MEIEKNALNLDNLLELLGNPTRRVILAKLTKLPLSAIDLSESLGISRQAVHSQLDELVQNNILEKIETEKRSTKYRIKTNISLKIDISPDYYSVKYNFGEKEENENITQMKDVGCSVVDYDKITNPNEKIRFLGENIKKVEAQINTLERDTKDYVEKKKCLILELKKLMSQQFEKDLNKDYGKLQKEMFFTMFFDPDKFTQKINLDDLLDELFSNMDLMHRDMNRVSINTLLKEMTKIMDVFRKTDNDWFLDI